MNDRNTHSNPMKSNEAKAGHLNDSSSNMYTREERHELTQLARGLRRVKRQLLLMQVEEPQTHVGSLRDILVKVAYGDSSNRSMPSSPSRRIHSSGSFDLNSASSGSFDLNSATSRSEAELTSS
jgi:hypothetical protein